MVRGDDAVVTLVQTAPTTAKGQTVVAEVIPGATPASTLYRLSGPGAIHPTRTRGCWTPVLAPVPLSAGAAQVGG